MQKSGIKDLMDKQRFMPKHIQKALLENDVPGNWKSIQNVYNLIKGTTGSRDPYAYVVLANLFNVDIEVIIYRYTQVRKTIEKAVEKKDVSFDSLDW
jgi:hypothetical protein